MGFSVIEKGPGYSQEYIYRKNNSAGRTKPASAKNCFQQAQESGRERSDSAGQASAAEFYERMRRFHGMAAESPEAGAAVKKAVQQKTEDTAKETGHAAGTIAEKAAAKDTGPESASARKDAQEDEDSKTDTEIIVKPDGSRVLVVTMNVGGAETSMTLELSKPTEMPNENRATEEAQTDEPENLQSSLSPACNISSAAP